MHAMQYCCVNRHYCIDSAVHACYVPICARLGCELFSTWLASVPNLVLSYDNTQYGLRLCLMLVVYPPAGRLYHTLFANQQHDSPSETSPHAFLEGSQGHAQAGPEEQQVIQAEGQQLHSIDRAEEDVQEEIGHNQRGGDQGMYHRPYQPAVAELQSSRQDPEQGQALHKAPQAKANAEEDEEADRAADEEVDKGVAETEAALAGAQEAQQQAVQAQQQALAEERRSLMQMRQHLQQQSG